MKIASLIAAAFAILNDAESVHQETAFLDCRTCNAGITVIVR